MARASPPARPRTRVEATRRSRDTWSNIATQRSARRVEDAVWELGGSAILVTRFVGGSPLPDGPAKFAIMGEPLGRLHALPYDEAVSRLGGASGEGPGLIAAMPLKIAGGSGSPVRVLLLHC